jgi:hypothetical protein
MDIKELYIELISLINKTTKDFVENNFSTLDLKYKSAKKLNNFLTPNLKLLSELINEKLKVNEVRLQKLQKLKVNGTPKNINLNRYIKEFNNIMAKKKKDNKEQPTRRSSNRSPSRSNSFGKTRRSSSTNTNTVSTRRSSSRSRSRSPSTANKI